MSNYQPSSREEKLALALQFAGLDQQQQAQEEHASGDQLHQALALIGLMQQHKNDEAQRAFQQQQLTQQGEYHQGELQNQQQQLKQSGEYQAGELANRDQTNKITQEDAQRRALVTMIDAARQSGANPDFVRGLVMQTPEGKAAEDFRHQQAIPVEADKFQPEFNALGGKLAPGHNVHPDVLALMTSRFPKVNPTVAPQVTAGLPNLVPAWSPPTDINAPLTNNPADDIARTNFNQRIKNWITQFGTYQSQLPLQ